MRFLNVGCGCRYRADWTNVDIVSAGPGVLAHDLRTPFPFCEGAFDVVYHSHVLEHFSRVEGSRFLKECHRVLRANGVIRVAVPDLERIARLYIEALDKSVSGDPVWQARYEWILLEMYDQTVRDFPGGEMLAFMHRDPIPERGFVASRMGGELERALAAPAPAPKKQSDGGLTFLRNFISRKLTRLALGREGIRAQDLGAFRLSGEVHRWMYDRYSLARLLEGAGFRSPHALGPRDSAIPGWCNFHLDTEPDGTVYKPDSLYMEAKRA